MKLRQSIPLFALAALTIGLTACGGSGSSPTPPATIAVTLNTPPTSLVAGTTTGLTANVTNDSKNGGVTWSCASSPCGSFSSTTTASGATTTYTAPATVPTSNTVTVTATSVSDTTKSASSTITITAPTPVISVAFNPQPPASLTTGATTSLTAVVTNDSKNGGVTWSCASSPCGSFSSTTTASGTATTYTAPAAVPTGNTVTITATSVTDTTKFISATITIALPGIAVAFNPQLPTSLIVGSTASLTAVVSNDTKSGGVTWTVTCTTSPCGSFSPTSTASGTATTYTAPTTIPNTVTITATSVTDTTKFISATVTIVPIIADGTYVFHISGQDAPSGGDAGPYFVVGAFTIKGGVITAGEQDFGDFDNESTDNLVPANCSVTNVGGNIQIVLATANTGIGVNGSETLRGITVSSSRILVSEFDAFAAATGSIDLQTSAAMPSGGYAFTLSGLDRTSNAFILVIGGVLNFSGGTLSTTGSVYDYNDGGTTGQAQIFTSGSVSAPDSFGRVTFSLTTATTSPVHSFVLTGYVIGTNQIQLLENQNDALQADIGGVALGQGTNAGKFAPSSISTATYVYGAAGQDINGLVNFAGEFSFNASGGVTGQFIVNDGLNFGATAISTATYLVDPTGRVTIQGVNLSPQIPSMGPFTFQLYLDGSGNALELGVDQFEATQGPAYAQSSPAPPADFEGKYALAGSGYLPNPTNGGAAVNWGAVGPVTVSTDAFSGFTDYTAQGFTPTASVALTGTETNSTALLSLTGLNGTGFTTTNSYGYLPIDSRRVLAIELDGQMLGLLQFEGVSH
jgi:hypothetical protein